MKKYLSIIFYGVLLISITTCASSYKQINPENLSYSGNSGDKNVDFSYQANVLSTSGNKKYAKKEDQTNTSVVAVRIKNDSESAIIIGENAFIQSGNVPVQLLSTNQISSQIKQATGVYLLYLLLTPMQLQVGNSDGTVDSYNIGYGVGPGISLLNLVNASGANSAFKQELAKYSLINKEINPGEMVFGLIGLSNQSFGQLNLVVSE